MKLRDILEKQNVRVPHRGPLKGRFAYYDEYMGGDKTSPSIQLVESLYLKVLY